MLSLFADWSPFVCCCFHVHKEAAILCTIGVGGFMFHAHFGLFSSLNLMIRLSCAFKKKGHLNST
jgi:hypothetical protein